MSLNKNKFILNGVLFFCILTLIIAYFIQYVLGYQPCNLCLFERIPYFVAVIIIPLYFFFNKFQKSILIIIAIFFIFGTIISFYHVGIEQGFFSESLVCDLNGNKNSLTAKDILEEFDKKTVSCKDVKFKVLGLSLATFNTIISLILSVIIIKTIKNYGKN
tara:strand:- start:790 stop:1272 length:483 start_codon:yes stop_codon:yes gene_type:complete